MSATPLAQKASDFLALHAGPGFVLPNAWDAGSARILQHVGFPAVATTSAGIALPRGRRRLRVRAGRRRGGHHPAAGPGRPRPPQHRRRAGQPHRRTHAHLLGVVRVSLAGSIARAALTVVERAGRELLESGTLGFLDGAVSYADVQRRFA